MANGDSGLDPVPPGSTYAIGGLSSNDPLVDWASNLSKDDLAKFLQNPQEHAKDLAARGIPPPSPEAMDQVHNVNEQQFKTPSRSTRFRFLYPPQQEQPGMAFAPGDPPPPRPEDTAGTPSQRRQPPATRVIPAAPEAPAPEGTTPGIRPGSILEKADKWIQGRRGGGAEGGWGTGASAEGSWPPPPTIPIPQPRPLTAPQIAPQPPPAPPAPAVAPAPAGAALAGAEKTNLQADKMEEAGDTLSKLGKAMQGVKAPEPLKPPGFASAPGRPAAINAPQAQQIASMLAGVQAGQLPASVMPILKLLGRA
jgi:hypothetical protein